MGLAPRPVAGVPGVPFNEVLQLAASILAVAQQEACDAIVVGVPVTRQGSLQDRNTDSQQGRRCRNFAGNLATIAASADVPVFLADEQGSTVMAMHLLTSSGSKRSTHDKRKDSVSAAVILETFFQDPLSAVLVKPWRPSGPGGGGQGRIRQPQASHRRKPASAAPRQPAEAAVQQRQQQRQQQRRQQQQQQQQPELDGL